MGRWEKIVASGLYVGYSPYLSGTTGTLVGVLIYFFLSHFPRLIYSAVLVGGLLIGGYVSSRAEKIFQESDSHKIVIDEITGYLITMLFFPWSPWYAFLGFILFRLLDIWKPFPIRRLQKLEGGVGVMIDDIVAGIYAHLLLLFIKYLMTH